MNLNHFPSVGALYQFSKFRLHILVGAYGRKPLPTIICSAIF
jgi:hypothetical protein